jgi:hypothetical protein
VYRHKACTGVVLTALLFLSLAAVTTDTLAERRTTLVIGNAAYPDVSIRASIRTESNVMFACE